MMILDDDEDFQLTYEALYFGQLMKNGLEKWKFHAAFKGEFPSEEEIKQCSLIVFPGSGHNVNEPLYWIQNCKDIVRDVYYNHPNIKMVGGCFGH
jgi:GMP synthase-like glutamine amidotransferase